MFGKFKNAIASKINKNKEPEPPSETKVIFQISENISLPQLNVQELDIFATHSGDLDTENYFPTINKNLIIDAFENEKKLFYQNYTEFHNLSESIKHFCKIAPRTEHINIALVLALFLGAIVLAVFSSVLSVKFDLKFCADI